MVSMLGEQLSCSELMGSTSFEQLSCFGYMVSMPSRAAELVRKRVAGMAREQLSCSMSMGGILLEQLSCS
jgi:hypothetical protein